MIHPESPWAVKEWLSVRAGGLVGAWQHIPVLWSVGMWTCGASIKPQSLQRRHRRGGNRGIEQASSVVNDTCRSALFRYLDIANFAQSCFSVGRCLSQAQCPTEGQDQVSCSDVALQRMSRLCQNDEIGLAKLPPHR